MNADVMRSLYRT